MLGRTWPNRGEKSLVHSLRSRRALLLGRRLLLVIAGLRAAVRRRSAQIHRSGCRRRQPADPAQTAPGDAKRRSPRLRRAIRLRRSDTGAIVVTGIRRSVQDSIQIKRREREHRSKPYRPRKSASSPTSRSPNSIARLPGIAAQRVGGRAEIVSIRGFSPDFTTVLLNGRQQASSGFNRAVEFDQYPSELLGSVVVYKTPDASIAGMGLAGTVDLRTIRPLEYGKRAIALNLRGQYDEGGGRNDDFSKYGWRGSVSYIDQNEDGTLGWMIGYAHLDAPGHTDHTKNWFYDDYAAVDGINVHPVGPGSPCHRTRAIFATASWEPGMEAERRRPFRPRPLLFAIQAAHGHPRRRVVLRCRLGRRPGHLQQRPDGRLATARFSTLRTMSAMSFRSSMGRQQANRPSVLGGPEQ